MRKVAALKLGGLTAAVGAELAQARLLSVYEALAADDIWGVRKACVESLPEIANALPVDVRAERLVPGMWLRQPAPRPADWRLDFK